jgi:hypothetical protein
MYPMELLMDEALWVERSPYNREKVAGKCTGHLIFFSAAASM